MANIFNNSLSRSIVHNVKKVFHNPYKKINLSWLKTKYYGHLPVGKRRTHQLFGKPFYFFGGYEFVHGATEIFLTEIYKQQLRDDPYILDCGANIGLSVIYMKREYPKATIVAFEPDEKNFGLLKTNVATYGFTGVDFRKEAVWKENTILRFSNDGSMASKIEITPTGNTIEIKAVRLRDFMDREIDFLKIDIEGAEYEVLKDIADKLHLVKNMFLEYHGTFQQNAELSEMIDIVSKAGFHYYIKEALSIFNSPFHRPGKNMANDYDLQLNIFCFRDL